MAPAIAKPLLSDLVAQSGQVPSSHTRPVGDRPRPDIANVDHESGAGILLIDLNHLDGPNRHKLVEAIGSACENDGFFMVRLKTDIETDSEARAETMSEEEISQLGDGELSQWLAKLEHPVHARRIDLALCRYHLMRQHYVMGSYRPYLTGSLGCELEAIIREALGIQQYYGRNNYTDELIAPRYGSNTGRIYGDANKLLNYHMLMAEISGNSNYLRLVAEARRRLGRPCPYGLYDGSFGGAGRLCYNAEAAGGRGGAVVVVPAAGVLRGAPAVQDIYPGALRVARIAALGGPGGSSADELYNHGQPRGRIGYQADHVADGGGAGFVVIDVGDAGQPECKQISFWGCCNRTPPDCILTYIYAITRAGKLVIQVAVHNANL